MGGRKERVGGLRVRWSQFIAVSPAPRPRTAVSTGSSGGDSSADASPSSSAELPQRTTDPVGSIQRVVIRMRLVFF